MYKRILEAIDGSHTSVLALKEAIHLAKTMGGRLQLVNVVADLRGSWFTGGYIAPRDVGKSVVTAGADALERAVGTAAVAGVKTDMKLIENTTPGRSIPEAIVEQADAWHADLIVVGTHGRSGLSHILLGSVAEGVVRASSKPVLLVRGK